MKKHIILTLLLTCCAFFRLAADGKHGFNHYSVENGMSHSCVEAILQDKVGFIWFGTGNGLDKFDGHTFRIFGNHHFLTLLEDPSGTIWTGTTEGLQRFDPLRETFEPFQQKTPEGNTIGGEVTCLKFDREGILWIGTAGEGLFRYDAAADVLTQIDVLQGQGAKPAIHDILPEANGAIFLATEGGLVRYEIRWNRCTTFSPPGQAGGFLCIEEEDNDSLLLGGDEGGIFRFDKKTERIDPLDGLGRPIPIPRELLKTSKEELWIGTESGIYIFHLKSRTLEAVRQNLSERTSISSNAIRSMCEDREGGIWIGTYLGGVNYTSTEQNFVTLFTPSIVPDGLHAQVIREFAEGPEQTLWIGTEDDGLYRYDRRSGAFRNWNPDNSALPWHNVSSLMLDGDRLYIGLQRYGICVMDVSTGTFHTFPAQKDVTQPILALFRDSRGDIQVGTPEGLVQFHPQDGRFTREAAMDPETAVYDIQEDHLHNLWLATWGSGLFCYDRKSGVRNWFRMADAPNTLSSDKVLSVMEDTRRCLWLGTEDGGACRFDPVTEEFERLDTESGLPSNTVYKVLEDKDGNVWFSTGKGLTRMSAETGSVITYSYNYGTPADQFNYKSAIKTHDGQLYFGTVRGFMEVTPENLRTNYDPPKVVFTSWSTPDSEHPLEPSEAILPGLRFRHNESNVTFRFAALSYTAPQNNRYAYRLRGLDRDWTYTKNNAIYYSRIPPGKYYLEIRGSNGDGIWSERPTSIRLVVKPPFLASWPGIALMTLSLIGLLAGIYQSQRKKMQEKNRREIERYREAEALATQKSRIDFFTSIIHEIRTPLSLIKAPFEQIKNDDIPEDEREEDMEMIEANIERLMLLSNEILDFSRIEENAFHLRPRMTEVNRIAEEVLRNFSFAIKERGFSVEKDFPREPIQARTDPEILIKILTNLLANATKYADSRILFRMEETPDAIRFRISNDGKLIAPEERERIFEAFYREERDDLTSGTGLGLSLVRKLVELHKGSVRIDETDTQLNTLVVEIPKMPSETEEDVPEESPDISPDSAKRTIAVVDDDAPIRQYLRRTLSKEYNVRCCTGAGELYQTLREHLVDLIICDIMMPGTDGITLCHDLKASFEYSHIPVILLSAKVDSEAKMEGLNAEADAFIEKPFTLDLVRRQIGNVFSRLDRMRDYYTRTPGLDDTSLPGNASDLAFMEKITGIITEHMSEEDFSIDKIADIVGMSRSTLYRKIRGVIQVPPGELIKVVRLKKAAQMLRDGSYRVSEVAFLVGFSSVSYFSTCFHKQFGLSPKEYMNG